MSEFAPKPNPEALKQFAFALHEIGHAALLPPGLWTHTSLLPVSDCPACVSAGEKDDMVGMDRESSGHTFYREPGLEGMQNILYSLAGGAAEVACGMSTPELMEFEGLGEYPIGMGGDFEALNADLVFYDSGTLREYAVELRQWFDAAVTHLRQHGEAIRKIAHLLV